LLVNWSTVLTLIQFKRNPMLVIIAVTLNLICIHTSPVRDPACQVSVHQPAVTDPLPDQNPLRFPFPQRTDQGFLDHPDLHPREER
jgi:hypothetical protein